MKILFVASESVPFVDAIKEIGHDIRILEPRCEAITPFIKENDWLPNIVHCYGPQSPPIVQFIRQQRELDPSFKHTAVVFTIDDAYAQLDSVKFAVESADVTSAVIDGIDYDIWNPAKDTNIARRYNKNTLSLKAINKKALQERAGSAVDESVPLVAVRSCSDELVEEMKALGCQVIMPAKINPNLAFAGADIFLIPANDKLAYMDQLIAYKYGTLPVEFGQDVIVALKKAIKEFQNKPIWQRRQQEMMMYDYSWADSAKKYISLYMKAFDKVLT